MATRVYELAKELGMGNKEMLSKLNSMGIEVSSHMNAISDKDCLAVRNAIGKSEKGKETKERNTYTNTINMTVLLLAVLASLMMAIANTP